MPTTTSSPRLDRMTTLVGLLAATMVLFVGLVGRLGGMAGAVGLVPALAAGRLYGVRGGVLWSVVTCVVMNLVLWATGHPLWPLHELATGALTLVLSGAAMGRFQDQRLETARAERARILAEARARLATSERLASLGTLAASIAHEINNPMSFIRSNLEYVREALATPGGDLGEARTAVAEAVEGVDRVSRIIADMQALSRGGDEALCPVDVPAAVRSALNLAGPAVKRSVTLVCELDQAPPVLATEARLGQVVVNLVLNAAQAMPQRLSSQNRVVVATRTDSGGRAVIEVRDNGCGIPRDVAPRIFDPFFTTKPAGVGTGLGLAICHSIVKGLGGELSFVTAEGQGTTFLVVLPGAPQGAAGATC